MDFTTGIVVKKGLVTAVAAVISIAQYNVSMYHCRTNAHMKRARKLPRSLAASMGRDWDWDGCTRERFAMN